ncbi:UDP-N-acetylmuramoyl-L-alanyl-D-glutamate--2,6-diaminopimelate ligase [Chamaesiphon polymorphus]|uniref:UDP-N-acetylmuramoyl-L-alanyl-D-glutamate--2,6-diaminopimelate ligase n=1 Tax=Chamaesiphon polymorphus CCALA 037 TaxID=2107692 RepID=A0A2T1F4N8_9CYAN|nr:UDP-N-acetylmuramoyl-L-alanyl-D-glutamate--2,6-diaminopimelate ligase [Chamaesiphon polymorphus]PSB39934.1 UDP-N-acetylmuramoyl-L-alanyl-D-glutamate--2,6-diaminopimelate ligase [Chamaesiphon polymorphus CCALA 037]
MKLRELLSQSQINLSSEHPNLDLEVTGLKTNSHACTAGDLFIGMPGTRVDGGEFWQGALAAGAIGAVISPAAAAVHPPTADNCIAIATDMTAACAALAGTFYRHPAQTLKMVGVTGTNGKTTTTHIIEYLLDRANISTALLGTLYTRWQGYQKTATHTTPFAVDLQQQLAQALAAGSKIALMEVSSHALDQGRVMGCPFEVGVFTNLTQDHLDYHQNMESYFQAKALLFSPEYLTGRAIVNLDDEYGKRLIAQIPAERVWSYSTTDPTADLWTSELAYSQTGVTGKLHTPQGEIGFSSPLVGDYNLENLLAAVGTALHLGMSLEPIVAAIEHFPGVPGRMERVQISPQQDITAIVDYAHTPDSLESLLTAARPFIHGKVICVFGCGGDRDRTKRPQMGKIAAELADLVVVTSDNPRTEDPARILQDVVAGIDRTTGVEVIADRAQAIAQAIAMAAPGDGVLIAGKGHEDYQILGTEKIHFDDREQARAALSKKFGG